MVVVWVKDQMGDPCTVRATDRLVTLRPLFLRECFILAPPFSSFDCALFRNLRFSNPTSHFSVVGLQPVSRRAGTVRFPNAPNLKCYFLACRVIFFEMMVTCVGSASHILRLGLALGCSLGLSACSSDSIGLRSSDVNCWIVIGLMAR